MFTIATRPARPSLPLMLRWDRQRRPLPIRTVRWPADAEIPQFGRESPPWWTSGPVDQPFDFCAQIARLTADVARRCPELRHLDPTRLIFDISQARRGKTRGLQARVTPLRCFGGALVQERAGRPYQVQRYFVDGREMLYLVTFCLPRFLDQNFDDKFITLFHELFHISPSFDGDLRRHEGRCAIHTRSQRDYDVHMAQLARAYLATRPDPALYDFLRLSFAQLQERHGRVVGVHLPRPRLVALQERAW